MKFTFTIKEFNLEDGAIRVAYDPVDPPIDLETYYINMGVDMENLNKFVTKQISKEDYKKLLDEELIRAGVMAVEHWRRAIDAATVEYPEDWIDVTSDVVSEKEACDLCLKDVTLEIEISNKEEEPKEGTVEEI